MLSCSVSFFLPIILSFFSKVWCAGGRRVTKPLFRVRMPTGRKSIRKDYCVRRWCFVLRSLFMFFLRGKKNRTFLSFLSFSLPLSISRWICLISIVKLDQKRELTASKLLVDVFKMSFVHTYLINFCVKLTWKKIHGNIKNRCLKI